LLLLFWLIAEGEPISLQPLQNLLATAMRKFSLVREMNLHTVVGALVFNERASLDLIELSFDIAQKIFAFFDMSKLMRRLPLLFFPSYTKSQSRNLLGVSKSR
jgi:hypothetical protein